MKQRTLFFVLLLLSTFTASAYDAKIDGVFFNLDTSTMEAEVTSGTTKYIGSVSIPEAVTYNGESYRVISIGTRSFYNCSDLKTVTIPNSVTAIKSGAFFGCSKLTTLTIPNSVISIRTTFGDCSGLTSIIVESGNPNYDSRDNCNAIIETATNTLIAGCKNTVIPTSVVSIESGAFSGCTDLISVTIPSNVTSIRRGAFSDCPNLNSIVVESDNPNYDSRDNCNAIIETESNTLIAGCKKTVIPNTVTTIGEEAFYACSRLISMTIPNSVTYIGRFAFAFCSNLTSVTIGNSVTFIGDRAFSYCRALKSLTIPDCVETIGKDAFQSCYNLTSLTIPGSMKTIGEESFAYSGITSATIPDGVEAIGSNAFQGCINLVSLTIPNSVKTIGVNAFKDCASLTRVYCYAEQVPAASSYTFNKTVRTTLYVPEASMETYKTTAPWSKFGAIRKLPK